MPLELTWELKCLKLHATFRLMHDDIKHRRYEMLKMADESCHSISSNAYSVQAEDCLYALNMLERLMKDNDISLT